MKWLIIRKLSLRKRSQHIAIVMAHEYVLEKPYSVRNSISRCEKCYKNKISDQSSE